MRVYVFIVGLLLSPPTVLSLLLGAYIFTASWPDCCRLVSSPPWLCNFITFDWWHLYYHWHLPLLLMSNFVFMLVISSPCRLRQLLPIDNFDYDRRTSYMLRGLLVQTQVSYLQFRHVPDTCNMNSWSWVYFICSKTGLFIIPRKGYQPNTCASRDSIIIYILEYLIRDNHSDQ